MAKNLQEKSEDIYTEEESSASRGSNDSYVIEDDIDSYVLEEDNPDANEGEEAPKPKKPHAMVLFLRLLATPVSGWKNIKRQLKNPEEGARQCFYPLVALAAACRFFDILYFGATIAATLKYAVAVFVAFFLGNFAVLFISRILLGGVVAEKIDNAFGKIFVMMAMSSFTLFYALQEILPMIDPILVFLPIYTIYLIVKGVKFLRIPRAKENMTAIILSILVIGMPYMIMWAFKKMLML